LSFVYCPECGFQNPEAANYCSKCGALLVKDEGGLRDDADLYA
jgi:ribosomal protein S27E